MKLNQMPPMAAVRAFEAVARHASFKAAAGELMVTPTAISHQVRQLEEFLGVRVLNRSPRLVELTAAGKVLFDAATTGLGEITRAAAEIRHPGPTKALTLSSTISFLSQWLVPRLAEIQRIIPDVTLRLHASDGMVDLDGGVVDVAVRYGRGPYPGFDSTRLVQDVFTVVCSPKLGVSGVDDLMRCRFIHVDGQTVPYPSPDWARWCLHAGVAGLDLSAGLRFTSSLHAVQAAIAGQGVAIVSRVLVVDALSAGILVEPLATVLPGEAYHFVTGRAVERSAEVSTLREWLKTSLMTPGSPIF